MQNSFTDEDKKKLIDTLNFIAKKAVFNNLKTEEIIEYFKLLAHMQQVLLPKIESHIFEVGQLVQSPKGE